MFLWVLICVYLILLAGFRYKLGEDTFQYLRDYEKLHPITNLSAADFSFRRSRFAPGFILVFSFFKMLSPEMVYFQLFQAGVVNTIMFYFLYKNCKNIFFGATIYFVFLYILLNFQQMREALAVSIFLLSWPLFRDNKWIKWYLASLLAFSFHLSAIIMFFLPLICLPGVRNLFIFGRRTWLILACVVIIGFAIYQTFFKYLELLAFTDKMQDRAEVYSKHAFGGALGDIKMVISTLIEYAIYPLLVLYILYSNKKNNGITGFNKQNAFVLINVYIVVFSLFIIVALRLTNYFYPFVIILLGDFIFSKVQINGRKYAYNIVLWFVFFLPMFFLHSYRLIYTKLNDSGSLRTYMTYYPYNSYLYENDDVDQDKAYKTLFRKRSKE